MNRPNNVLMDSVSLQQFEDRMKQLKDQKRDKYNEQLYELLLARGKQGDEITAEDKNKILGGKRRRTRRRRRHNKKRKSMRR